MQQLVCPQCGTSVTAENINIQEMISVCQNCDTVFPFERPTEKVKRRKVKQPQNLTKHEDERRLHMQFRTNFRLDRNEAFLGSVFSTVAFVGLTNLFFFEALLGEVNLVLPVLLALFTLMSIYRAGLIAYNQTHIDMTDERIRVSRQPLRGLRPPLEVDLSGVVAIDTAETEISIERNYDTPRYRVWAERADGTQRVIVNDLTEEYAYYVSRVLDERLQMQNDYDTARLVDDADDYHMTHSDEASQRQMQRR